MIELILAVWLVCGILCAVLAGSKGRSRVGWFFAGIFFGLIALAVLACLGNKTEKEKQK